MNPARLQIFGARPRLFRWLTFQAFAWLGAVLSVLWLAGCRTVPDVRPFAGATAQLSSSIKTTGRTLAAELEALSANWNPEQRQQAVATATKFGQQWGARNALADALLDYSASLAAIAQAGEQGESSARAVAGSFQKLTDAVGVALPQAEALGVAVNAGSYLYGKFAQDRAARTLGESLRRLQPAVEEAALLLGKSLAQMETGLDAVRDQARQNLEDESLDGSADGSKVRTARNRLKRLSERRVTLLALLDQGSKTRDDLRADLLKASDAAKEKEFARLAALTTDLIAELASVEGSLKSESERLAPFDARAAADRARLTTAIELVQSIRTGLNAWAAAHARVAAAALAKQPLQMEDLVQAAVEIRDLIKTVRAAGPPP